MQNWNNFENRWARMLRKFECWSMNHTQKTTRSNNNKMRSKCLELNHREVHNLEEENLNSRNFRAV